MKIYLIEQAGSYEDFAQFGVVGTWSENGWCEECGYATKAIVPPLQIEWEPGSTDIGDFAWDGGYTCVVQSRVRQFLREKGFKCRCAAVEHMPLSERVRKRDVRVTLPYTGPKLYWLDAIDKIVLDEKRSRVKTESVCSLCGRTEKTFKCDGIVIDADSWRPCHIFRIVQNEPSAATFVTDEGRQLLLAQDFSNLDFREAGRIDTRGRKK